MPTFSSFTKRITSNKRHKYRKRVRRTTLRRIKRKKKRRHPHTQWGRGGLSTYIQLPSHKIANSKQRGGNLEFSIMTWNILSQEYVPKIDGIGELATDDDQMRNGRERRYSVIIQSIQDQHILLLQEVEPQFITMFRRHLNNYTYFATTDCITEYSHKQLYDASSYHTKNVLPVLTEREWTTGSTTAVIWNNECFQCVADFQICHSDRHRYGGKSATMVILQSKDVSHPLIGICSFHLPGKKRDASENIPAQNLLKDIFLTIATITRTNSWIIGGDANCDAEALESMINKVKPKNCEFVILNDDTNTQPCVLHLKQEKHLCSVLQSDYDDKDARCIDFLIRVNINDVHSQDVKIHDSNVQQSTRPTSNGDNYKQFIAFEPNSTPSDHFPVRANVEFID